MKLLIVFPTILYLSCFELRDVKPADFKGIWIPQKIKWQDGNFDTYCFLDDSSVVIISSVQKKVKDSIVFRPEPGFNIKKGTIKLISEMRFSISYKIIYRFIKLTDVDENKTFEDIVTAQPADKNQRVFIYGIR